MPILTLAAKDLRLLLRDPRSAVILLLTPLLLILVLGLVLGEGFGQTPDDRLLISIVNLDKGHPAGTPFAEKKWSDVVINDIRATKDIRVEMIPTLEEAERLMAKDRRAAIIVFGPDFSDRMHRASFLTTGDPPPVNPLGRNGAEFRRLDLQLLTSKTQPVSAAIIEQMTQVTLLRVVIPWMIGKAFQRVGDDAFMEFVAQKLKGEPLTPTILAQIEPVVETMLNALLSDTKFQEMMEKEFGKFAAGVIKGQMPKFKELVKKALHDPEITASIGKKISLGELLTKNVRQEVGPKVKLGVKDMFSNYNFEATRWDELVNSERRTPTTENVVQYRDTGGSGWLNRGALRYQILVPSYTVMFAFFLVLSVGWLFVAERKHGTLVRLRAAPLTRGEILMGKLLPCLAVSLVQGLFLLAAGRIIFGMTWGSRPELLLPLVACTAFAAVGLSVLVASIARTETQVAVYGTLIVLVLAGVSGSLMPRDLMPEQMKTISLITPHAWALDAYAHLLASPNPDVSAVLTSCAVLLGFGAFFIAIAWWRMDLD